MSYLKVGHSWYLRFGSLTKCYLLFFFDLTKKTANRHWGSTGSGDCEHILEKYPYWVVSARPRLELAEYNFLSQFPEIRLAHHTCPEFTNILVRLQGQTIHLDGKKNSPLETLRLISSWSEYCWFRMESLPPIVKEQASKIPGSFAIETNTFYLQFGQKHILQFWHCSRRNLQEIGPRWDQREISRAADLRYPTRPLVSRCTCYHCFLLVHVICNLFLLNRLLMLFPAFFY